MKKSIVYSLFFSLILSGCDDKFGFFCKKNEPKTEEIQPKQKTVDDAEVENRRLIASLRNKPTDFYNGNCLPAKKLKIHASSDGCRILSHDKNDVNNFEWCVGDEITASDEIYVSKKEAGVEDGKIELLTMPVKFFSARKAVSGTLSMPLQIFMRKKLQHVYITEDTMHLDDQVCLTYRDGNLYLKYVNKIREFSELLDAYAQFVKSSGGALGYNAECSGLNYSELNDKMYNKLLEENNKLLNFVINLMTSQEKNKVLNSVVSATISSYERLFIFIGEKYKMAGCKFNLANGNKDFKVIIDNLKYFPTRIAIVSDFVHDPELLPLIEFYVTVVQYLRQNENLIKKEEAPQLQQNLKIV